MMVWLIPTAPGPAVSIPCHEALALLCALPPGTSLSSPLADIFMQSVRFPPTHTPTELGYGKNPARLGIHPCRTGIRITFFWEWLGSVICLGRVRQFLWRTHMEMPLQTCFPSSFKQGLFNVLIPLSFCPYCRFGVFFMLCLWFYSLLSCTFYKWI